MAAKIPHSEPLLTSIAFTPRRGKSIAMRNLTLIFEELN
jgi:hypothetical protein